MDIPNNEISQRKPDSAAGNILITAVLIISILSMFGAVMSARMISDADATARYVNGNKAFFLADAGVQWARRYLVGSTANKTFGPATVGGGRVTVQIQQDNIYTSSGMADQDIYRITSTATVGNTTRQVEEFRYRGGANDKDFMLWRENTADEF
jgi:hypothetical protein